MKLLGREATLDPSSTHKPKRYPQPLFSSRIADRKKLGLDSDMHPFPPRSSLVTDLGPVDHWQGV